MRAALATLAALTLVIGCGSHDRPEPRRDPERVKRVIEPPSGKLRPLPPHAIRADGVGPYRLGASLAELLDQLPSGPRLATFDIPGVVHRSVLRADDDAILVGGEPLGKATFVAVVRGDIALTESGLHVGSTRDELVKAVGAPDEAPDRARDPRLVAPSGLRDARVVLDHDRVVAIVVSADADHRELSADKGCTRPAPDGKKFGACLTPTGELVSVDGDDITVRAADSEKQLAHVAIPGLVFAAPLRTLDGKDELVAIARSDDPQLRTWSLVAFRLDGARLVREFEPAPLYQVSASNARWIGAELRDVELYLEVAGRPDAIEVGGLLTTRIGDSLRDAVVISPVLVPRHKVKPIAPEASDAGAADVPAK